MTKPLDFKKEYKDLYMPKTKPSIIDVPKMKFIMIDGKGDPNTSEDYKNSVEVLYALSYGIKMSKMKEYKPKDYFEYVVAPLEGLWSLDDEDFRGGGESIKDKSKFYFTSMIRQPDFVDEEFFEMIKKNISIKKPDLDLSLARLEVLDEGLCAQIMHIGPYDDEPATIKILEDFINKNGYETDITDKRLHHEIYLSDPRKTLPEKLKTVIRHPVRKK